MRNTYILFFTLLCLIATTSFGQTGPGVGIYSAGTETGFGFRLNKDKKMNLDIRVSRVNLNKAPRASSFVSEFSGLYRIVFLEKVRFHLGLGLRADWNLRENHKFGPVIPIGVEAFPFPFQNAGLFFEAAPFATSDFINNWNLGVRTVAGFVFYFPTKVEK